MHDLMSSKIVRESRPCPGNLLIRPALSHDRFSDGDFPGRYYLMKFPVEMAPILSTIIVKIRYFEKRAVLIRKKPAPLAAFFWSRKTGRLLPVRKPDLARNNAMAEK
jgi:hypothetical protein